MTLIKVAQNMIYHVARFEDWEAHQELDHYKPPAFLHEGFIHCCSKEQIQGVLERYFKNQDNLLLIEIDDARLKARVLYEEGSNKDFFPHVYGSINKSAVVGVRVIA
jgi:uncharacterized protein (DUF952 family)